MAWATMTLGGRRLIPLVTGLVGLVGCAGLMLTLSYRHNVRIDLSPQRHYTLSSHAKRILAGLDREVRITVFVRSGDPRTPIVKDLMWRVGTETPRVSYEFVDLNRSPVRARQYGVDRYGATIIESGGRRRDIANPSEGLLVGAILGVTRPRERVVYFVTGHGEHSPADTERRTGYSTAKRALEDELFTVRDVALMSSEVGVPSDASVVVIAGPRKEFLPTERRHLETYLARGGNLLLLLDPESPGSVGDLVRRYGVTPSDRVIVDPEHRLASGEGVTMLVPGLDRSFLISGSLEAPPVFSNARSLRVAEGAAGSTIAMLETGAASYEVPASELTRTAEAGRKGPFAVGVAILPSASSAPETAGAGRVVVYGDADFASNAVIDYLGNKDLLVNSINWLAGEDALIATRAAGKELGREQFFVTQEQQRLAFWLATVAQPAVFLVAGLVVFVRRRLQ